MRSALVGLLAWATLQASASLQKVDVPLGDEEAKDIADVVYAAASACAILLRYQIATPRGLEITHVGGGCDATELTAVIAASFRMPVVAAKVAGEAAKPPVYECSVNITWDPATANAPTITGAGVGCEAVAGQAVAAAVKAIACMHLPSTPCR